MDKYQTFRFKKFDINHQGTGMKIGTDGILLGAWSDLQNISSVLDLGTGSGLVALMCAQRFPNIHITGIDIEEDAYKQALENFKKSPFQNQLKAIHSPIQKIDQQLSFDAIVSNPPFFMNSLKANNEKRNIARHTDTLSLDDLFQSTSALLKEGGKFIFIYPFDQLEAIENSATKHSFYKAKQLNISHNITKLPKRVLLEYLYQDNTRKLIVHDFYIRTKDGHYTEEYINLTKNFHPFLK